MNQVKLMLQSPGVICLARRQAVSEKAVALKRLRGELTQAKERAEQVQMEKERKVRRLSWLPALHLEAVAQQACMRYNVAGTPSVLANEIMCMHQISLHLSCCMRLACAG